MADAERAMNERFPWTTEQLPVVGLPDGTTEQIERQVQELENETELGFEPVVRTGMVYYLMR